MSVDSPTTLLFTIYPHSTITGVPKQTSPVARNRVVTYAGVVPNAAGDMPAGIIMNDSPTNNPPPMVDVAGNGCIVDNSDLNMNVETDQVWSDDDGTYSVSEPTSATTTKHWRLGYPISPTKFVIDIQPVPKGAA